MSEARCAERAAGCCLVARRRLWLRVIALTSACDEAGLGDSYFEVMIFVRALGCGCGEGDLVVGRAVGNALLQHRGDIIIELESETAALDGEHLESQIGQIDLTGF